MKPFRCASLAAISLAACAVLAPFAAGAQTATADTPAPAASEPSAADKEIADKEAAGQLAAAGWLLTLDRQNWGGAWDGASQVFRSMVPIASWMEGIPKVRAPFGAFESRKPSNAEYKTKLAGRPDGEYVTAVFITDFADRKGLEEIVTTVREADGRWRVTGYSTR